MTSWRWTKTKQNWLTKDWASKKCPFFLSVIMIVFFTRNKHLLSQSTQSMLRADFSKIFEFHQKETNDQTNPHLNPIFSLKKISFKFLNNWKRHMKILCSGVCQEGFYSFDHLRTFMLCWSFEFSSKPQICAEIQ